MLDLNDATLPPDPTGGWSTAIKSVPNAVVNHLQRGYLVHSSGIFDADGGYVPEGVLWRGRAMMVPPPMPETPEYQPGRWLWGGKLLNHFGHFLIESTGRLWALDHVQGQLDGIVFIPEGPMTGADQAAELKGFQRLFFDLLGITLPIKVLTKPTRFEHLEVPGQGFGIGPLGGGTDPFRAYIQKNFAIQVQPEGGERLYISRSELDVSLGGILGEMRLERYLAENGYEVFHPQNHSLTDQIARYKAAKQVVGLDGSALHLFAMAGTPEQRVALIKRRSGPAPDGIVRHLRGFTGQRPLVLDTITHNWVRSDRKHADNFSYGELDFARLGKQLSRNGFVPAGVSWRALSAARAAAAMQGIEEKMPGKKHSFNAVPVPEPAPEKLNERRMARKSQTRD
ncbi:hypothetical protein GCM10010873_10490 [Cypionkella aquatica]|uniref:Glycosyltransferase 61 catalytic domain-containing protein n=2 Tax=Cypionkella aquatica TaxID=1756042 RepID=A0AA37X0T9_9RHOB|nr:hypothetical protein GCM10010873_10490 [Cypionkella aquatica]